MKRTWKIGSIMLLFVPALLFLLADPALAADPAAAVDAQQRAMKAVDKKSKSLPTKSDSDWRNAISRNWCLKEWMKTWCGRHSANDLKPSSCGPCGGGLTIIANAPNPAGVSILKKYFNNEVSPGGIFTGALAPTIIVWFIFLIFRGIASP